MRKRILWIAALSIVGTSAWWWTHRPEPAGVRLHIVERGTVEATASNTRAGTITACRRAKLSPSVSGQIIRLPFREGAQVRQGDVLLELWNEDIKTNRALTEQELKASEAQARATCALAAQAEREAARQARLRPGGLVSADLADKAQAQATSQRAQCHASEAQIDVARARFAVLDAQLERTIVRAPFDGIIAELNGELFEITAPSPPGIPTPPAVDLVEYGCIYIEAPIDEVDAASVRVGMPVRVSLDAFRDALFDGHVRRIGAYVEDKEKQARFVTVEIDLADDPRKPSLLPGYSADAEIVLDRRDNVLRIPSETIMEDGAVLVFDPARGLIERRPVRKGLSNWRWAEVTEGLREGERVVLNFDDAGVRDGEPAREADIGNGTAK
ncbi:MAG: efflux RND transporter periplasmic adaptor subunit [Pseudomonadota bacterium]